LRRYSPTKLYDGAQMAIFWVLHFQRAAHSTFQTCILNSHYGHTMCRSMVNIQSQTAEIRRGKKIEEEDRIPQHENIMAGHNQSIGRGSSDSGTKDVVITVTPIERMRRPRWFCLNYLSPGLITPRRDHSLNESYFKTSRYKFFLSWSADVRNC